MSLSKTDPQLIQLAAQLLFLQKQLVNQLPQNITAGPFIGALEEFIDQLGEEIQRQSQ